MVYTGPGVSLTHHVTPHSGVSHAVLLTSLLGQSLPDHMDQVVCAVINLEQLQSTLCEPSHSWDSEWVVWSVSQARL